MARCVAVLDACVLYPASLRDLLIELACSGLYLARWSAEIHAEWMRNLVANRPDLSLEKLERTRQLMIEAVDDSMVTGYESIARASILPDAKDRHVLAAAIRAGAETIVTANGKHFPDTALAPYGIQALHPDEFVLDLMDLDLAKVLSSVRNCRARMQKPPRTVDQLLDVYMARGLIRSAFRLGQAKDLL